MYSTAVRKVGRGKGRRLLHWIVAAAFLTLFVSGLIVFVPAFASAASGGWTRLAHRAAAIVLVSTPLLYAVANPVSARAWLREVAFWNREGTRRRPKSITWKTTHKVLITAGFILFALSGMVQWFLKGMAPSQLFQWSLSLHDVIFLAGALVLLYHLYYEFRWWLWKRRYCRSCAPVYCAAACPNGALTRGWDGRVEYHPRRCNNCRLCLDYCRRNAFHRDRIEVGSLNSLERSGREGSVGP